MFRDQLQPADGQHGRMMVGCRWPGHWVECGEADGRVGGDRSRRALMPAETGPVYLPTVLSLRLGEDRTGGLQEGSKWLHHQVRCGGARGDRSRSYTASGCSHCQPGVQSRRRPRPWRHGGWSRLDSRLGHRHIGRAGGEVSRGGSQGESGNCRVCFLPSLSSNVIWNGHMTGPGMRCPNSHGSLM